MNDFNLQNVEPWVLVGGAGMLGRIMYHAKQVQAGKRKPLSWLLLWDVPIAVGMGWMALGIGAVAKTPWEATISLALASAYLGPYAVDTLFARWADARFGGKNGTGN